jgi:imidazolonepropionase-like amidohydrolase
MKPLALFLLIFGSLAPAVRAEEPVPSKPLAITHVTVIDATGAKPQDDMTVIVTGDRITALGPASKMDVPAGAQTLDGSGKFLIPGLWDLHVHIADPSYLDLFLANGVTGVREMHAFLPDTIFKMRDDVQAGKKRGPRIVAAGALIDGPRAFWTGAIKATTPDEGREAVRSLKKRGADFIKVYESLAPDTYHAIVEEAKKQEIPFVGHVPRRIRVAEASDSGQRSIEHLTGLFVGCAKNEDDLLKEMADTLDKTERYNFELMTRLEIKALDSFDAQRAADLYARFAKNGTYQCPTLTVLRMFASLDDEKFLADTRVKYMPVFLRAGWTPEALSKRAPRQPETVAGQKRLYQKGLEQVGAMRKAGVEFLAGTDTTNPFCFPGFSLHDELALLVEAGLTPMEALQAATSNPAKFFGRLDTEGTVEQGKRADLVLLDADPLAAIGNTKKLHAVVVGGKLLERETLDKMLADLERPEKKPMQ